MIGACRADAARRVGAWRRHWAAKRRQQAPRCLAGRHAKRDPVEAGACQACNRTVGLACEDQGHRPGPEARRKGTRGRCRHAKRKGIGGTVDMADQRVEGRPVLRREDGGDGICVAGITAKPVHRFRRKGDKPAASEFRGGRLDRGQGHIEAPCRPILTFPGHCRCLPDCEP